MLLIISYCIIIHPRICIFVILGKSWCRMKMRRARLVSNAFLYTTELEPHLKTCRHTKKKWETEWMGLCEETAVEAIVRDVIMADKSRSSCKRPKRKKNRLSIHVFYIKFANCARKQKCTRKNYFTSFFPNYPENAFSVMVVRKKNFVAKH